MSDAVRLDVNFNTFGDRNTGSSRLRAWMLADELTTRGHRVTVNGARLASIEVFQKVRNRSRIEAAVERGVHVVFDIDDNYLLEEVGAREDVVAAINLASAVTVGSHALRTSAEQFHDRVWLFENPLDVPPGTLPRPRRGWTGRIGWFGNRTNLVALTDTDLQDHQSVVTVTRGGTIEWQLDTIDETLKGFDLVVLPASDSEWGLSKNANRLLKCVGLGVPALISETPEHRRIAELLDLPPWVLVGREASWREKVERSRLGHRELEAAFAAARDVAWATYGIGPTATRWMERAARPAQLERLRAHKTSGVMNQVDVIVLADGEPDALPGTLTSLRLDEQEYASVRVISAVPLTEERALLAADEILDEHDDFFDVYGALEESVQGATGTHVLLVRAGAEVRPAFFGLMHEACSGGTVTELRVQTVPGHGEANEFPETLSELLTRPYVPWLILLPREAVTAAGGLTSRHAAYAPWELLIRLASSGTPRRMFRTPVATIAAARLGQHPMHGYAAHTAFSAPGLERDLPGLDAEWQRLRFTLHSEIVERHAVLFATHLSAILPQLDAAISPPRGVMATAVKPPKVGWDAALWRAFDRRGMPRALRLAVRSAWLLVRPLVPTTARARQYRRYRAVYEQFFPERRPRRR